MRRNDLKNRIKAAYAAETPDLRAQIEAACKAERQEPAKIPTKVPARRTAPPVLLRRTVAVALCLMLFVAGFAVGLFVPDGTATPTDAETFVYLDVNPSIELQLDGEGRVLALVAGNEDAEEILTGLELVGVEMNTALTAILGSMYVNGYLSTDSNSILVSIDAKDEGKTETLLTAVTDKINQVLDKAEMECSIIAQSVKSDAELKQRAEAQGISVGKMHLVEKMVKGMEMLDEQNIFELAEMSIKDLSLMYSAREENEGKEQFDKDVVSGDSDGGQKQEAFSALIAGLAVGVEDIERYDIELKFERNDKNGMRMIYAVTLVLKDDPNTYQYKIDCKTGELLEEKAEPQKEKPEKNDKDTPFFP